MNIVDIDERYFYCNVCGEDKDLSFLSCNASNDWYRCNTCGNDKVTVSNLKDRDLYEA